MIEPGQLPGLGSPDGIRTRVTGLRGRRPRPLDDGAEGGQDRLRSGGRIRTLNDGTRTRSVAITPPPKGR